MPANTFCTEPQPSRVATPVASTVPVTCLVTARFRPCRTKKVPRVMMKLGSRVFTSRIPLSAPTARLTTRAAATPTHTLRVSW